MNVERVIEEARSWLGTPWHHQARMRGAGVDCVMLVCEVYEAGVIPHVEPEYYPIDIMMHRTDEPVLRWFDRFADEVTEAIPGDVVAWKFGYSFSHAGIVTDAQHVIHSFRQYGQVIETRMDEGILAGRARRFYRFRETT
jgi:cell wall-associated NlpC family hydrolase